jgi:hypothetical protein
LPEGVQPVRVEVLDGFVSFGWSHYATCGRRATGGWARADALYAVRPRYTSLDSEEFRVTFLGHEAQHLADLARFPGMPSWQLEYRAKLAELACADTTRPRLLAKFRDDQNDDAEATPHSYANRMVWSALHARLAPADAAFDAEAVSVADLQQAARAALLEDSRRRAAAAR